MHIYIKQQNNKTTWADTLYTMCKKYTHNQKKKKKLFFSFFLYRRGGSLFSPTKKHIYPSSHLILFLYLSLFSLLLPYIYDIDFFFSVDIYIYIKKTIKNIIHNNKTCTYTKNIPHTYICVYYTTTTHTEKQQ